MASVFISHRRADNVEAERLAADLRARGHDVWLDVWEIELGDSIVEKMNSGLSSASYVVLCLSRNGSLSPWMSREWMSTLARQLAGAGVRLLPIRLTGGDRPAILADIKFADLTTGWTAGVNALCTAIH